MIKDYKGNLDFIKNKIKELSIINSRNINDIELIAVSKTFSADDVLNFYNLGLRNFGENYIKEWISKRELLPKDIIWHIIGNIQSNKTSLVAKYASWVHSLDSIKIAKRLSKQREGLPLLNICIEVNISRDENKHGIFLEEVRDLASNIIKLPNLKLRGLMCVPSNDRDKTVLEMRKMYDIFQELNKEGLELDVLSMGMTSDFDIAIANGATHLRIGTALFGSR